MTRTNLWLKLAGVALLCGLAGFYLYPPGRSLKLGIDLDGGYSLLYEIDEKGLDEAQKVNLADNVIGILKKRVDPDNVRNLVWRTIGNNRIEIQMPRPSAEIQVNRAKFNDAYKNLAATNVTVEKLYAILRQEPAARDKSLNQLAKYAPGREKLIASLENSYDARIKAQQEVAAAQSLAGTGAAGSQPLKQAQADLTKAKAELDRAIDAMLATNFPMQKLMDGLESGPAGTRTINQLTEKFPERKPLVEPLAAAYGNWAKVKSGLDDPTDLERLLRGAGVLEFRILVDPSAPDVAQYVDQLKERGPRIHRGDAYGWFPVSRPDEFAKSRTYVTQKYGDKTYVLADLSPEKGLTNGGTHPWKLVGARVHYDLQNAGFAVSFQLDDWGGQLFSDLTARNIGKHLCILLDNEAISAPVIRSRIGSQGEITGNFTNDKATQLSQVLNAGALPARLKEPPLSIRSIGSTLGETNRNMGLYASYLGFAMVVLFMAVYYLFGGVIADVAVFINLLFTLGIMAALDATFTLPGVAALILSVGMAVDSNVLIFERLREEAKRGHPFRLALRYGYERAWRTILDANVTTLISCVILYYFGSEEIRGFALVLGLGLVANVFTAVFVTRWIFELLLSYNLINRLPMLHLVRHANIDWCRLTRYFIPVSAVVVASSLVLYFSRNPKTLYDIEFLGGTSSQIELKTPGSMNDEQVRAAVTGRKGDTAVQWLESAADSLDQADVTQVGADTYTLSVPAGAPVPLSAKQIQTFLEATGSPLLEKNGIRDAGEHAVTVSVQPSANIQMDGMKTLVADAGKYLRTAANKLAAAQVQVVREEDTNMEKPRFFEIVTTETNEYVVRDALVAVLGDKLSVERAIQFQTRLDKQDNDTPYFPVTSKDLTQVLHDNTVPPTDVREYMGGVALVVDHLQPAITTKDLHTRLANMRLQPDYEHYAWRQFEVVGLKKSGVDAQSHEPMYRLDGRRRHRPQHPL